MQKIKVVELFAGVGGFRIGLEKASSKYEVVWSNQWEPSTKKQEASDIYVKKFGNKGHSNEDISTVSIEQIPSHDLLVGGFPCQDYSVAKTLKNSNGLEGKKGVLWWQIHRILKEQKNKPAFVLLENVDRLIKSPVKQRGRDFAIMLSSLTDLGYIVEWRIINAADYGMPQRRRRVFIMAYHEHTKAYKKIAKLKDPFNWILKDGTLAQTFNVQNTTIEGEIKFSIEGNLFEISDNFNKKGTVSLFENNGIIINRNVYTVAVKADFDGPYENLGSKLLPDHLVPKEYFINEEEVHKWEYFKGAKNEKRINKASGFEYNYKEGGMVFPDPLDKPSRTIITGEGGAAASRFKHVVKTSKGKLRRLMPIELERLNMFPDNHTEGATDIKRAFFMGNALVVGVIEQIGKNLLNNI
jgi:DNA (cytosine-5)-methyltransferase 1